MKIVTAGSSYMDIDAYAGCIAYAELLQATHEEAIAVSTAPLNESISRTVRTWQTQLRTEYTPSADDRFVVIDVSDPKWVDGIVDLDRVEEVIDHHPGFEQYWQERIGSGAQIEFIGAACTLVYERWQSSSLLDKMSTTSARLLITGILDNTLNFGAQVTSPRDSDAYDALLPIANLPEDWPPHYFSECQEAILQDAPTAIRNDSKNLSFKTFGKPTNVGQLAVWDSDQVLARYQDTMKLVLSEKGPLWFMNMIDVGRQTSHFVTDNPDIQDWLAQLLSIKFEGSTATADRLWLRKEILQQDIAASAQALAR